MERRYLVYHSVNGRITAEIQYGQHHTGEGIKRDMSEVVRKELLDYNLTLDQAIKMYPYEEKTDEKEIK